jgi:hypothetical protein
LEYLRRGSGAFYAFSQHQQCIDNLAVLWSLTLRQYAPNLEFVQARGKGNAPYAAYADAYPKLLAAINMPVVRLPYAPPPAARNRRTG